MIAALVATGFLLGSILVVLLVKKSTRHLIGELLLETVLHPLEHFSYRWPRAFDAALIGAAWAMVLAVLFGLWFGFWLLAANMLPR